MSDWEKGLGPATFLENGSVLPKGNFTFSAMGREVGALVDEKNAAYGSSFDKSGQILGILYPDGIKPEQYTDALAIVRIIDKLFRIATNKDAFNEDPWRDIAGYGLLGMRNNANRN